MIGDLGAEQPIGIPVDVATPSAPSIKTGSLPETPGIKPLEPGHMLSVARGVKKSFEGDQVFADRMTVNQAQAERFVQAIKNGELDEQSGAETFAVFLTQLEMASKTDLLTELDNRQEILRIMEEQVAQAKRSGKPITVVLADIDHFKLINDQYGHVAGDAVLNGLGNYFKTALQRETDKAGRLGGEEFGIVLSNTPEVGAYHFLDELRTGVDQAVSEVTYQTEEYVFNEPITISIGFVTEIIDGHDPRQPEEIVIDLLNQADKNMYLAKHGGRNRVVGPQQAQELDPEDTTQQS